MDLFALNSQLVILGQVILAMFLSAFIGYERESKDKPAGLRTHMFIGGTSALFVALGSVITREMVTNLGDQVVSADSIRIMQAIVTGIAFLGAGTIFRKSETGDNVYGLTTAASILFVAGIGIAVASSVYLLAIGLTLIGLFVLHGMNRVERWMKL